MLQILSATTDNNSSTNEIVNTVNQLFPSIPVLIATLIAFIFVFLLLTKLLYKPIKKYMAARQKYIQDNIDASLKNHHESLQQLESANNNLNLAKQNANDIITKAKLEAEQIGKSYIAKSQADAKQLIENAKSDIALQQKKFETNIKQKIIDNSVALTKKILEQEITPEYEQKLIAKFESELKKSN